MTKLLLSKVNDISCVRSQKGRSEEEIATNHRRMCEEELSETYHGKTSKRYQTRGATEPELDDGNDA